MQAHAVVRRAHMKRSPALRTAELARPHRHSLGAGDHPAGSLVTVEGMRGPSATRRAAAAQDPGAAQDLGTCCCRTGRNEPPSNRALDSSAPDTRQMEVLFMFTWWISGPNRRTFLLGRTDPGHGGRHRRASKVSVPLGYRALRRVAVQPGRAGTTA